MDSSSHCTIKWFAGDDNTTQYKSDPAAKKPDELSVTRVAVREPQIFCVH
jgi:hypothetical protein